MQGNCVRSSCPGSEDRLVTCTGLLRGSNGSGGCGYLCRKASWKIPPKTFMWDSFAAPSFISPLFRIGRFKLSKQFFSNIRPLLRNRFPDGRTEKGQNKLIFRAAAKNTHTTKYIIYGCCSLGAIVNVNLLLRDYSSARVPVNEGSSECM